jgi:hypothetical protein
MPMVFTSLRNRNELMKKILRSLFALALLALPLAAYAGELSSEDKQFLASYEKVRAALAADDLEGAKKAADDLGDEGAAVAKSEDIKAARSAFTAMSERAIELGRGQSGYYVANCPMLKKDWLQTSTKISNPYDPGMPECGVIRK